jgi:hypothetical protein
VLQRLFVEGHAGEAEEIVLEIVEIPGDGLAIEAGARIADFVIEVAAGLDLKPRQHGDDFAIGFDDLGSDGAPWRFLLRNSKSVVSPRSSSR